MAKANGTFTYPMSSQKDIADAGSNYDNILSEFSNGTAFRDVTVNPILKTTHVTSETTSSSVTAVPSVIFTEIRKGPHDSSISNDSNSQIGNRILPVSTLITDYGTARDNSPPFKIRVFDDEASGDTNRKFVYSTIDAPETETLGIDIDNYDYFILDQWGVMHDGVYGYSHAIKAIDLLIQENKKLMIISNSSKRKINTIDRLNNLGFDKNNFV